MQPVLDGSVHAVLSMIPRSSSLGQTVNRNNFAHGASIRLKHTAILIQYHGVHGGLIEFSFVNFVLLRSVDKSRKYCTIEESAPAISYKLSFFDLSSLFRSIWNEMPFTLLRFASLAAHSVYFIHTIVLIQFIQYTFWLFILLFWYSFEWSVVWKCLLCLVSLGASVYLLTSLSSFIKRWKTCRFFWSDYA